MTEDKEELRADRAVKVPKKEVNELIAELLEFLEPDDDEEAENGNDTTQCNDTMQECSFSALQEQRIPHESSMYMLPQSSPAPVHVPMTPPMAVFPTAYSPATAMPQSSFLPSSPMPMRSPVTLIQASPIGMRTPVSQMQFSPLRTPIHHKSPATTVQV